jgi:nucleotide-binding universal stress UspA family protein
LKASIHATAEDTIMEIRRILAPTDFSEPSKQAIAYAFELAQTFEATLVLLHIIEPLDYSMRSYPHLVTAMLEYLERQAHHDLAQLLLEAQDVKVEVTRRVVVGPPYRKIVEVVTEEQADLIVMATHGRTGLSHLVMGSVAERVMRMAPCPVLTIRPTAA